MKNYSLSYHQNLTELYYFKMILRKYYMCTYCVYMLYKYFQIMKVDK